MLIKVIALFLIAMMALAVFGRLRMPGSRLPPPRAKPPLGPAAPVICIRCGTPIPGAGDCACGARRPSGRA